MVELLINLLDNRVDTFCRASSITFFFNVFFSFDRWPNLIALPGAAGRSSSGSHAGAAGFRKLQKDLKDNGATPSNFSKWAMS